ncbi:hypothetical protein diail_3779 [Diaporthe ilicicola]|nr:hypothetical protein diail_3779 [Diaporthe ilicicola]
MENPYPQVDQGRKTKRLRQKDIEELRDKSQLGEDKLIPIWQQAGPKEPLTLLVDGFSRAALTIFSPFWKKALEANPASLVLHGPYLGAYKLILNWINLCIKEGNDVKFPEIEELETKTAAHELKPEHERPHQLHVLLEIIAAANYVQIPEGSLQSGLKKRIPGYARKHLIDLAVVERIYSNENSEYDDELREIAAISIFEAWWNYKLDDAEFDEYMARLAEMRVEYPQLDADLHQQFDRKKDFIEGKREERKRNRDGEGSAPYNTNGFNNPGGAVVVGAWDSMDGAAEASGDGWNQAAAKMTAEGGIDWEKTMEETPSWATGPANMCLKGVNTTPKKINKTQTSSQRSSAWVTTIINLTTVTEALLLLLHRHHDRHLTTIIITTGLHLHDRAHHLDITTTAHRRLLAHHHTTTTDLRGVGTWW